MVILARDDKVKLELLILHGVRRRSQFQHIRPRCCIGARTACQPFNRNAFNRLTVNRHRAFIVHLERSGIHAQKPACGSCQLIVGKQRLVLALRNFSDIRRNPNHSVDRKILALKGNRAFVLRSAVQYSAVGQLTLVTDMDQARFFDLSNGIGAEADMQGGLRLNFIAGCIMKADVHSNNGCDTVAQLRRELGQYIFRCCLRHLHFRRRRKRSLRRGNADRHISACFLKALGGHVHRQDAVAEDRAVRKVVAPLLHRIPDIAFNRHNSDRLALTVIDDLFDNAHMIRISVLFVVKENQISG